MIRLKPEWAEHEPELDLALHTGLRRGSMYRDLVWENVDAGGRIAMIPRSKNDEPIVAPLNDVALRALAIFRARGNGCDRVVRNAWGETLNINAHWFPAVARAAGVKDAGIISGTLTRAACDKPACRSATSPSFSGTRAWQ